MKFRGWQAAVAVTVVTLGVGLLDAWGVFTRWELWGYDRLWRWQPGATLELPVVQVWVTPVDMQGRQRLTDRELHALIQKLLAEQVAVVGVDMIRDVPVGGDGAAQRQLVQLVAQQAQASQGTVILTCLLSEGHQTGGGPPPGLPQPVQVVGFADVVIDPDRVVRRSLLVQSTGEGSAASPQACHVPYSLGFLTALTYLAQQGYHLRTTSRQELQIHRSVIPRLTADAGPYRGVDTSGYQVLLRYRQSATPVVTMRQVMTGPSPIPLRNRVVLVGYGEGAAKTLLTPLGALPSVAFHAQTVAQILRLVLGGERPIWWWPRWGQGLWLLVWSGVGAWVGSRAKRRLTLELLWVPGLLPIAVVGANALGGWVPWVAPGLAYLGTGVWVWGWVPRPLGVFRPRRHRALRQGKPLDPQGRYRIHAPLGEDGTGWLYAAMDQHVGKTVVVRVLKLAPSPQRRDELRRLFVAQVERYVALQNLHLIQILDFGLTPQGFPFYVREYLPGTSLRQRLRQQAQFSPPQAVHLVRQICKGLEPAHQQGWTHQDLKPDNIFLIPTAAMSPLGELVKILDFGFTQWIHDTTAERTLFSDASSLPYTAPELFVGATAQPSADVYSLGMLLYRLVSGHYPFPLTEATPFACWYHAHLNERPWPLTAPHTQGLDAILQRCLAKDPHQRYPNAQALDQALQDWQTHTGDTEPTARSG
jgi:CHASE2 domain-containing sensor protein